MMVEDMIRDENENTRLDFKRKQYPKKASDDFIKDVMAMANADTRDDRYIILGVAHEAGGTKTIIDIPENEFVDPADYQQIIGQYIEPPVHLDYKPFMYDGKRVGILRVYKCDDRPYMMSKQFSQFLREGDCWIRSGARNRRATRADFDRMYKDRYATAGFQGTVKIGFADPPFAKEIHLPPTNHDNLPSELHRQQIEAELCRRREIQASKTALGVEALLADDAPASRLARVAGAPYSKWSTRDLEMALAQLEQNFEHTDLYDSVEKRFFRLNILLLNQGEDYVEDASVVLAMPRMPDLLVVDELPARPRRDVFDLDVDSDVMIRRMNYPGVQESADGISASSTIGDLKHGVETPAFAEALRIGFGPAAVGKTLAIQCTLRGKNLRQPIVETLHIQVVEQLPSSQPDAAPVADG